MKIGDDERIKDFIIPPPRSERNILSKKDVDFTEMKKNLFPGRPMHSSNCRCRYCREFNEELDECFSLGCSMKCFPACRRGLCALHHEKEINDCGCITELL